MNLIIKCGFSEGASAFTVTLQSSNPSVATILSEAKISAAILYPWYNSEGYYLAHPRGPFRLDNVKHASDYRLCDGDTLLLLLEQKPLHDEQKKQTTV